ncbi:hypothetical protein [Klebsiella pneumoniae]|uniref:hypothetical protein n=1 Tax=Klebsiella pneumoniae TaxID=573 RepID=UPI003F8AA695
MITNKQILTEVEQLSRLFKDGEADIPSMWNCFWPGLAAMFWLLLWPIAMFSYKLFFFGVWWNVLATIMAYRHV